MLGFQKLKPEPPAQVVHAKGKMDGLSTSTFDVMKMVDVDAVYWKRQKTIHAFFVACLRLNRLCVPCFVYPEYLVMWKFFC